MSQSRLADIGTLEELQSAIRAVKPAEFSKHQRLVESLRPNGTSSLDWDPERADDRQGIFTESLVTLDFLRRRLPANLNFKPDQVLCLRSDIRMLEILIEKDSQAGKNRCWRSLKIDQAINLSCPFLRRSFCMAIRPAP